MPKTDHTPGRWTAYGFAVMGEGLRQVADCNSPADTPGRETDAVVDEDRANAQLISACPGLLDAAQKALTLLGAIEPTPGPCAFHLQSVRECLQAAIRKATGT